MDKETLKEAKHNCEGCQGKGYLDKTDGYDYGKVVCPVCINDKEPKHETLEEASREYWKRGQFGLEKAADTERAFLRGGLWQKARMYSEEDINAMFNTLKRNSVDNVATITNVDLFIKSWKREIKKG